MSVAEYDEGLVEQVATTLDLRSPNKAALDALVRAIDGAAHGAELVADLATGVGKTYIAGGLLDYLYESGVRNVVIVTPGSTIQKKTVNNLTPGNPKFLRGLQSKPLVITLDDLEAGAVGVALEDPDKFKVFIFTVQSLLKPNIGINKRAHRPHETLGQSLSDYLREQDDLVIIADEHHVYFNTTANQFRKAVKQLDPAVLVGLTATPHESTQPSQIVYHYPIANAIADGYVKIPVLVARQDSKSDTRTQMADGLALLDAKAASMKVYTKRTAQPYYQPLLFVVAQTIDQANSIHDLLAGPDFLNNKDQVLLITSEEPDETLRLLDTLEEPNSPIRAVVSVSMLKEGWDVKNIYVIAAVRALASELLTEQILGRGLRLPFGHRTGVSMLDTVEVLSHDAFADLLKHAEVLLEQTLGERAGEATAQVEAKPGIGGDVIPVGGLAETDATTVVITLPGNAAAEVMPDPGQGALFPLDIEPTGGHTVVIASTVGQRIEEGKATNTALNTALTPRTFTGVPMPLFIPRVTRRWIRDPFSLKQINTNDAEALGQKFARDHAPILIRKMLGARHTEAGEVAVTITDVTGRNPVYATQTTIPFDHIKGDLVQRLMRSNAVEATTTESNAAVAIAGAFLIGAAVTKETPWRAEHGHLATEALVNWIRDQQTSSPAHEVSEIEQVKWPEPPERYETQPPTNRNQITNSKQFIRGYPYTGWKRSIYATASFDSYSAEFKLAELLETTSGIKAWTRVINTVPLLIPYVMGATMRHYRPDFIVIDAKNVHWVVEGKADSEMTDMTVMAKRDAAQTWVNTVNSSNKVAHQWGYLLASESTIKNAANWHALRAAAQVYT